jgi:hypothetical protein
MSSNHHETAHARLDRARDVHEREARKLGEAEGTNEELHASVQTAAAADQVKAREAWTAWSDRVAEEQ